MRLVRLTRRSAMVSEDIRAALAALGRGSTVVGGIALVGARPEGCDEPVDAIVLRPDGIVIVVGVDLPDPAVHLDAPLRDKWKADGWPLVRTDHAVNPATDALALAATVEERIRSMDGASPVIGTVVAVGPYVETVEQPAADLAGRIRVLHPTPTSMLAAIVSLSTAQTPMSVTTVRRLLNTLAPDAPAQNAALLTAEGFPAEPTVQERPPSTPNTGASTHAPAPPAAGPPGDPTAATTSATPGPLAAPRPPSANGTEKPAVARWLPLAALGLLVILLVTAVALAATGSDDEAANATDQPPDPLVQTIDGLPLTTVAVATAGRCAPHATGELQRALRTEDCTGLTRGSFTTTAGGRRVAVSVAELTFTEQARAEEIKQLSDTPGNGAMTDLATETGRWSAPEPGFAGAAYTSDAGAAEVRVVQAGWVDGAADPLDPALVRAAEAGLAVSLTP
ncbi:hypothetical protein SAMN05216266_12357 [Amycolatopsis marina]|uniref:Uncharacterized protein n=1 Tax=Amycolatopsis marina TaxID=490629 RepID=A0A1I1C9B3_9PSEU|nr:hypothetical protein [Amycolatopsis marina]SFB59239.1 hypothetical protein SAMN05216266_12357 [Amycolatopsis marina]